MVACRETHRGISVFGSTLKCGTIYAYCLEQRTLLGPVGAVIFTLQGPHTMVCASERLNPAYMAAQPV